MLRVVQVQFKHTTEYVLRGVLWKTHGPWLVFVNVTFLFERPGSERDEARRVLDRRELKGDVWVHRTEVVFLQEMSQADADR